MGLNASRPQYGYTVESSRIHPTDYFRRCDPDHCYCGGSHPRQRHVAIHQNPGATFAYQDPMQMMDRMMINGGYGGYLRGTGGYPMSNMLSYPGAGATANILIPGAGDYVGGTSMYPGWPPEWKDARDWTTRDFSRLGEIMDEYWMRQRGRVPMKGPLMPGNELLGGMPMFNPMMSGNPMMGVGPMMPNRPVIMDDEMYKFNPFSRMGSREGPTFMDFERLKEQMAKYAQDAREHVQSINDFLYGSEREQKEERYKDRQRKMIEEILKSLNAGQTSNTTPMAAPPQQPMPNMPQPPFNPMNMMGMGGGMNPYAAGMGGPPFIPGMANMDPMGALGDMRGGMPLRLPRSRRPPRGLGYGDEDDFGGGGGGGGFGRRNRRGRGGGFNDEDDDFFNQEGDGRRGPKGPRNPRRPRPNDGGNGGSSVGGRDDTGGFGAFFDDGPKQMPPDQSSQPYERPPENWSQPYRASSPPPIPPRPRSGPQPAPWPAESGKDPDYRWPSSRSPAYDPAAPEGIDRMHEQRPRVSFQEPSSNTEPPAGPSRYRIVNDGA